MKWMKFRLKTTTEAEDLVSSMLRDLGVEGIEIEDNIPMSQEDKEKMFVDILPETGVDDGVAYISFYRDPEEDHDILLKKIREELEQMRVYADVGDGTIERSQTEDLDWINNWKKYFKQFYVDDILIIPSWEEVKEEDKEKLIIQIDPGTAFGSGMHETTQLCIRQIKKYIEKDDMMLDVGTGSGILSVAGIKLGVKYATGTDLDENAVRAVEENMEKNQIPAEKYQVIQGNIIEDKEVQRLAGTGCYDIVVANILADVLIPLTPAAADSLKSGGIYITSGIIKEKEEDVSAAVQEAGLKIMEVNYQGEWVSITAKKQ